MADPILAERSKQQLLSFLKRPTHALLVTGDSGMGKQTVISWLISQLAVPVAQQFVITPIDGKAVGIETARGVEHFLSLKVNSKAVVKRAVIIIDAHMLTIEAQNALLKTIEEPPVGTAVLASASSIDQLLPTVRSRLQHIQLQRPTKEQLAPLVLHLKPVDRQRLLALADGLPGLTAALAQNDSDHPLVQAVQTARQLLQASTFERLTLVDQLVKQKDSQQPVLRMLMQMAHAALLQGSSPDRWHQVLQASYNAQQALRNGVQPKLALTNLMLHV